MTPKSSVGLEEMLNEDEPVPTVVETEQSQASIMMMQEMPSHLPLVFP